MIDTIISSGVSETAQFIEESTRNDRRFLHTSAALGIDPVLYGELTDVWEECKEPNWDGYDAFPVTRASLSNTYRFLEALPIGSPRPTVGAEPSGQLTVEWYKSPRRVLSVSIDSVELLHYAALLGPNKTCGTETFFGDVPESILQLIRRVYS